jgi:hypothetical protein
MVCRAGSAATSGSAILTTTERRGRAPESDRGGNGEKPAEGEINASGVLGGSGGDCCLPVEPGANEALLGTLHMKPGMARSRWWSTCAPLGVWCT